MSYRLVAFDFDGTLADSFHFFLEVCDVLADAHGFARVDRADLERLRGLDARQMLKHVGLSPWKTPQVALHFRTLMAENVGRISLFPGTGRMLARLAERGLSLAVVTSNSEENVRAVLGPQNAALVSHFECGVSLFGKRSKLRQLVAGSGFGRGQCLYVGDEVRDAEAAHAERLHFGAVAWGYTRLDALLAQAPEAVFHSVAELAERLAGPGC